jgi:hypothetical protein
MVKIEITDPDPCLDLVRRIVEQADRSFETFLADETPGSDIVRDNVDAHDAPDDGRCRHLVRMSRE